MIELSDFGPWVAMGPTDTCAQVTLIDTAAINCADTPDDPGCDCIAKLDDADLSGSLIQGSRFLGASLTYAQFNSATIAESTTVPSAQPENCLPGAAETAYQFCLMSNQCQLFDIFRGPGSDSEVFDCGIFVNAFRTLLPDENVGGAFRIENFNCALSIYEAEDRCVDVDDIDQR